MRPGHFHFRIMTGCNEEVTYQALADVPAESLIGQEIAGDGSFGLMRLTSHSAVETAHDGRIRVKKEVKGNSQKKLGRAITRRLQALTDTQDEPG